MEEIKIMIADLNPKKKKELLAAYGLESAKEGGLDENPFAVVKIPEEWQVRITKGNKVLMTWTVLEDETDDGGVEPDFYVEDLEGIEEKIIGAFEAITEMEEVEAVVEAAEEEGEEVDKRLVSKGQG